MKSTPQALFLTKDAYTPTFRVGTYNHQRRFMQAAADAGWEVFVSSWNNLLEDRNRLILTRGLRIGPQVKRGQPIQRPIHLAPIYVNLHISPGKQPVEPNELNNDVLSRLRLAGLISGSETEYQITKAYARHLREMPAFRHLVFSEHELLTQATGKWQMEKCFRRGEQRGWHVARPATEGVNRAKLPERLPGVLDEDPHPRIIKPHTGTRCEGIHVVTRQNLDQALEEVRTAKPDWYVMQELVHPTSTYQGHKVDLRIFVGVLCLDPLRFHAFRQGLVRVAHEPFRLEGAGNPLVSLTGRSFRKRMGVQVPDLALETYFGSLSARGYDVDALWAAIQPQLGDALRCLTLYPPLQQQPEVLQRVCPLVGCDIILREGPGRRLEPMVLEINYFPQLYGKGDEIDRQQDGAYQLFFRKLAGELAARADRWSGTR